MPEKKEWVWGFLGPIPFLQQRFVPDVVIQQDRRGRVIAPPAGGAANQPAAPAAPAAPARQFAGRIPDDELAREDLEEARERELAADLRLRATRAMIMADLKTEAVQTMEHARLERTLAWARELPPISPMIPQSMLEEFARRATRLRDEGQRQREDTTTRREPQVMYHSLRINGIVVPAGGARVNIPYGYITLNAAPGPQGYAGGTQVTLEAHPDVVGSRVQWRGATQRNQPPLHALVTLDQNRDVGVTITPPAARPAPGAQPAGGGLRTPPPMS